jgi:hypothetical protein
MLSQERASLDGEAVDAGAKVGYEQGWRAIASPAFLLRDALIVARWRWTGLRTPRHNSAVVF